jgi:hypothetical protein
MAIIDLYRVEGLFFRKKILYYSGIVRLRQLLIMPSDKIIKVNFRYYRWYLYFSKTAHGKLNLLE